MADNIAVTEGTGKTVATDDVGGAQYQRVKLDVGADGATLPVTVAAPLPVSILDTVYGDYETVAASCQRSDARPDRRDRGLSRRRADRACHDLARRGEHQGRRRLGDHDLHRRRIERHQPRAVLRADRRAEHERGLEGHVPATNVSGHRRRELHLNVVAAVSHHAGCRAAGWAAAAAADGMRTLEPDTTRRRRSITLTNGDLTAQQRAPRDAGARCARPASRSPARSSLADSAFDLGGRRRSAYCLVASTAGWRSC